MMVRLNRSPMFYVIELQKDLIKAAVPVTGDFTDTLTNTDDISYEVKALHPETTMANTRAAQSRRLILLSERNFFDFTMPVINQFLFWDCLM